MQKINFKRAKIIFLILVVSYFVISRLYQNTNQVGEIELRYPEKRATSVDTIVSSADTQRIKTKREIEFDPRRFSLKHLIKGLETGLTCGRCNRPDLIEKLTNSDSLKYGYYSLNFVSSQIKKPPYMGTLCVSFQKEPWRQDDPNQDVLKLVITEKEFENSPVNIRVGDSIEDYVIVGEGYYTMDNVIYRVFENHVLAIVVKKNKIDKYILWPHPSVNADVRGFHEKVKNSYL